MDVCFTGVVRTLEVEGASLILLVACGAGETEVEGEIEFAGVVGAIRVAGAIGEVGAIGEAGAAVGIIKVCFPASYLE